MYAKAHPFGYKAVKNKHERGYGEQPDRIQTVKMESGQTRTITHYDKRKKGRTLGDMVYGSQTN